MLQSRSMNDLIRDRQAPRDSRLHHSSDNELNALIDDRQTSREEELQASSSHTSSNNESITFIHLNESRQTSREEELQT